ncbi:MAG: hypothetical protein S0880_29630 [Actinomycetota bacterium]|nr:hypothetical protein [Actinomycetota bacterium]
MQVIPDAVGARTGGSIGPDVVIWEADGRPLGAFGYGGCLARALRSVGARVELVRYRDRPLTTAELDAPVHVLSGGETSAFSHDDATLRARADLTELMRRAWHGDATIIGVCLGAQLISRAIAPDVPLSTPLDRMEAGLCEIAGPDGPVWAAELHYEEIHPAFAEVDGVTVTHTNTHSPIQGFRWGATVSGYQFHPEWTPDELAQVLRRHDVVLDTYHRDPAGALASVEPNRHRWSERLLGRLVLDPVLDALAVPDATAA